ncbi:MAG: helix-turn-helix transcriptional regulator [Thermoleophilaceae bacterium]|nr:helix-turn-helix transcriptional regulator [Thermoleophilaceae bacterium]
MGNFRLNRLPFEEPFAKSKAIHASEVIRSARLWVDVTQTEIARRSGINQQTISAWERGRQEPSFAAVMRVLGACGLDVIVTPVVRPEPLDLPGRIIVAGGQLRPRSLADGLAQSRRIRRAQLRQYARERAERARQRTFRPSASTRHRP